jgi:hypothetical protein
MRTWICVAVGLVLAGCGASPVELDNDQLSDMLSLTNLSKRAIRSPVDPAQIIGLGVEFDVVNVAAAPVEPPFTVVWTLRDGDGRTLASATGRVDAGLAPGSSRHVALTLSFAAVASLEGYTDVVTFNL